MRVRDICSGIYGVTSAEARELLFLDYFNFCSLLVKGKQVITDV